MLPFDPSALSHHRQLVARMSGGDKLALQELYELQVGRVHAVVARILVDREEAREAVQDAFVKAWRGAAGYRPDRGEVIAWLVFIARNSAIDRLRQSHRRAAVLTAFANDPGAEPQTAEAPLAAAETRESLEVPLAALTIGQRQAVELAFFAGCSQAEIALRMQVPVSTVKNHLHRGLTKLRQLAPRHD